MFGFLFLLSGCTSRKSYLNSATPKFFDIGKCAIKGTETPHRCTMGYGYRVIFVHMVLLMSKTILGIRLKHRNWLRVNLSRDYDILHVSCEEFSRPAREESESDYGAYRYHNLQWFCDKFFMDLDGQLFLVGYGLAGAPTVTPPYRLYGQNKDTKEIEVSTFWIDRNPGERVERITVLDTNAMITTRDEILPIFTSYGFMQLLFVKYGKVDKRTGIKLREIRIGFTFISWDGVPSLSNATKSPLGQGVYYALPCMEYDVDSWIDIASIFSLDDFFSDVLPVPYTATVLYGPGAQTWLYTMNDDDLNWTN